MDECKSLIGGRTVGCDRSPGGLLRIIRGDGPLGKTVQVEPMKPVLIAPATMETTIW